LRVGVLALQGDFREHLASLNECGASAELVRTHAEIAAVDALVIPGGESTTIYKLAKNFDLVDLIRARIASGMPTYGSCAGMILVSREILDPASGQETFGGIDMRVRRNAFGRQVDSFEVPLDIAGVTDKTGTPYNAVFIRAPWAAELSDRVEVLASVEFNGELHPVAVRQGSVLATSFHPEITSDTRVHQYFLEKVAGAAK
jgi:pyridoxal 5'-phosphate synthase pdxT subunit